MASPLLASFTWAKQMTNAEDEIGQFNDGPQDAFNLQERILHCLDAAADISGYQLRLRAAVRI